jgi:UPF0176 protein
MKKYRVLLFYKYINFAEPELFMQQHLKFCMGNDIKGRVFIGSEGINGTVSGTAENIEKYKKHVSSYPEFNDIWFKEDMEEKHAFSNIFVRVKEEIVNSGLEGVSLKNGGKRLKPEELKKFYETGKEFVIIDARNWYESSIGKFKDAVAPPMKNFREWTNVAEELKEHKDKTIITYCTGGIRCEKASAYLVEQGFKDVFQLEGGIVNYVKQYPDTYWEGSVFVFDERRIIEPNTKKELKHIANCYYCGTPTSYYINCHNLGCDKILVSCHKCKVENDYCCSNECRQAPNRRKRYYG